MTTSVSGSRGGYLVVVGFGALGLFLLWIASTVWRQSAAFAGVWLAAGFALLGISLFRAMQLLKYGDVKLYLEGGVWPGGKLRAAVRLPVAVAGTRNLAVKFQCKYTEWTIDRDGDRRAVEVIAWSKERDFPLLSRAGRSECRFEFDLPTGLQPTSSASTLGGQGPGFYWEIVIHADVPGIDLIRSFAVEVVAPPARFS